MKKLSAIILFCGLFFVGNVQADEAQDKEFQKLLQAPNEHKEEAQNAKEALSTLLQKGSVKPNAAQNVARYETYFVHELHLGGYHFHIADYPDGTKIVTCLDGSARGLQGISYRGVLTGESRNVQWSGSYFIHHYPRGKVTSYPNRQISEVY